jgi:tripartite-type tricarboxylate transporter receptor subunit TctC
LLNVLSAADEVGRPFIMSKKVPADVVKTIRQAFNETMKDKDFLSEAKKQQLPVNPLTGEQAEKVVDTMMAVPPKIAAQAKTIYE